MSKGRQTTPIKRERKGGAVRRNHPKYAMAWDREAGPKSYIKAPHFANLTDAPPELQKRAWAKYHWVHRFVELGMPRGRLMELAEKYAEAMGVPKEKIPKYNTLRTWALQLASYDVVGLVDRPRKDIGTRRAMSEEQMQMVELGVVGAKSGPARVFDLILKHAPGDELPSYDTVCRAVKDFKRDNAQLVAFASGGALYWRDVFSVAFSHGILPAGYRLSVDSTVADLWVRIWDGKIQGWRAVRPVLTVVEDIGSRAFLAFNLSLVAIDSGVITATFLRAINAEAQSRVHPGLPSVGIPYEVAVDKGAEHQALFTQLLDELQINRLGKNDNPRGQSHIERIIETVTTEVLAHQPGYSKTHQVFDPYAPEEGDTKRTMSQLKYEPYRGEVPVDELITLERLEESIWAWATTYNRRPHVALKANLQELGRLISIAEDLGVPLTSDLDLMAA